MESESRLKISCLRILVLMMLVAVSYQFGYTSGRLGGDFEQLQRQITANPFRYDPPLVVDVDPSTAAVTASNDTDDIDSAG